MKPCRDCCRGVAALAAMLVIAACGSRSPIAGPTQVTQPSPTVTPPPSTTSLSGQVNDLTSAGSFPLAGASVSVTVIPAGGGLFQFSETTTGADGRYAFPQLPVGSAVVQATSAGRRQVCGALPTLTANTRQDLEVTSSTNPARSASPAPLRVTGQIYEMTPAGRVGLSGAVIYLYWQNDGYYLTVVADADGNYLACGLPTNRRMAFEVAKDISAGYNGEYETPYVWEQFSGDATRDFELKKRR